MMAQKSVQVPKFGNWEGEADVPYTACFDKAFKGHPRGEPIRPSSHQINAEKLCHDASSPGQADPHSEKDNLSEKVDLELPKFGDWDGQGVDVPYTIYFEKVRKRGGRGKTTSQNDGHLNGSTGDARRPARRELEEKSHEHQKGQKSGAIVRADSKQGSKNRLQESSAVLVKENKKMLTRRNPDPDSKQCQTHTGAVKKEHPVSDGRSPGQSKFDTSGESRLRTKTSRNEEVVPITAFPRFGRWDETDPSSSNGLSQISKVLKHGKEAAQSASVKDSFYGNSQTKIKEQKAKACCFPWGRK